MKEVSQMSTYTFIPKEVADVLHKASLRVLEKTGVRLDHEEAQELLLDAGAKRDDEGRILIPPAMVEDALRRIQAAGPLQMFDRDGNPAITLKVGNTFFGPGSDALYNVDLNTGQRRKSVLADVRNNVRVADALPNFEFMMSMGLPEDVNQSIMYATVFAEMVHNSAKPIVTTATNLDDIMQIHHIACIVAGGEDVLREKPFFIAYLEPISPLKMDRLGTERLLYCAEHGIPILYAAGANCGSGAPVTPEGGVVQGGAESLAGLVLALLKNPEARFIYGANTSAMDMRSTIVSYGDPIWFKTVAMYADLGKFYGLPSWGTAGSSDAFHINAQSAMEAYEGISLALWAGSTLVHDVAYLAHGELYDARMLVLTDMMIGRARHVMKPVDLSPEALAMDVIDEVARKDDIYLSHPHTAEHFKAALWIPPKFINRRYITDVNHENMTTLLAREVNTILEQHTPAALDSEKSAQIKAFLEQLDGADAA